MDAKKTNNRWALAAIIFFTAIYFTAIAAVCINEATTTNKKTNCYKPVAKTSKQKVDDTLTPSPF